MNLDKFMYKKWQGEGKYETQVLHILILHTWKIKKIDIINIHKRVS